MKSVIEIKRELRKWVLENARAAESAEIEDDTPIIEKRLISSVQIMDLILFMEHLRGDPLDPECIRPGSFTSINAICKSFFQAGEK